MTAMQVTRPSSGSRTGRIRSRTEPRHSNVKGHGSTKVYRVTFMKTLYGSTGRRFDCCQRVVELVAADEESAVSMAQKRFCDLESISEWLIHADWLEVRTIRRAA